MNQVNPTARLSSSASLAFDGLRLVAAQAVLLGHSFDFFGWFSSLHDPNHAQIQRLGVVVFFLLSGFLIPYSVHKAKTRKIADTTAFSRYLVNRFSRIYCGLLPALLLIAVVDALPFHTFEQDYPSPTTNTGPWIALANALQLQEYPIFTAIGKPVPIFGSGDPLWSLPVEWWIYVLFGVLTFKATSVWALALAAIALPSVAVNLVGGTGGGIAGAWVMGWCGFLLWRRMAVGVDPLQVAPYRLATALFASGAIVSVWLSPQRSHFSFDPVFASLAGLGMVSLMLALHHSTTVPERLSHLIRSGANYSFTLYLTHFSVLTLLYEFKETAPPPVMVAVAVVVCNGLAFIVALGGERHTSAVRRWIRSQLWGESQSG